MKKNSPLGSLMLLTAALIWGGAFVAQSEGMNYVGALTFNSVRFFIGAAALVPVMLIARADRKKRGAYVPSTPQSRRTLIVGGILCGLALSLAACIQQYAIIYTTVSKAGFITTLYIIIVPVLSLFIGRRPSPFIWLCVAVAAVGLYFLCISGSDLSISLGDGLAILCSLFFAVQIMLISHYVRKCGSVELSFVQFLVAGTVAGIFMLAAEKPSLEGLWQARWTLLYTGVLSCGVAYTCQVAGQKRTNPILASLIMSLESVFATVFGALILKQIPSPRELFGCALVFAAVILAQLIPEQRQKKDEAA